MDDAFQLILFPGLGADYRLLTPQQREFPQLVVPPWIPPSSRNETLPEYAARMAESVKPSRDKPLVLGGVSFGGMLAYEMSRHLKPDATVLIASCRSPQSLRPTHRAARRLLPFLPVAMWEIAKLLARPVVRLRFDATPTRRDLAVRMFRESDSRFMHWTLQAILNWKPAPLTDTRVLQIHGRRDLMIPARRVQADEIIENGGHLINVTHAKRVNAFLHRAANLTQP